MTSNKISSVRNKKRIIQITTYISVKVKCYLLNLNLFKIPAPKNPKLESNTLWAIVADAFDEK